MISRTVCLRRVVGMGERGGQPFHRAAVGLGNAGVDARGVLRGVRHAGGEAVLSDLKLGEPLGQGAVSGALLDDVHDVGDRLRGFGKLAAGGVGCIAALTVEPIGFLRIEARLVVPVMDAVRVELEAIAFRDGLKRQ
jgi:hypothetical protein